MDAAMEFNEIKKSYDMERVGVWHVAYQSIKRGHVSCSETSKSNSRSRSL